jgi:manganese transport protein
MTLLLVGIIGGSFVVEIVLAKPEWASVVRGLLPGLDPNNLGGSLYIAIGMLGATVMPHNLYLHSALVQTRAFTQDEAGKRLACKYNFFDSLIALNGAFFINSAILVLAAATFTKKVDTLQEAHVLLADVWGGLASVLFAVALLASGQSSTLTGTLAGQVVMEGFVQLRIRPWLRRLVTRLAAIVPALVVLTLAGSSAERATLDGLLMDLLVLSQVTLSFQLPFAIIPLVQMTSDRARMGVFASGTTVKVLAWISALIVVALNVVAIGFNTNDWAEKFVENGSSPWWVYGTVLPLAAVIGTFLGWVTYYPYLKRRKEEAFALTPMPHLGAVRYTRIGVGLEFSEGDPRVLAHATTLAKAHHAPLVLIHVVEGTGAVIFGEQTADRESEKDRADMTRFVDHLRGDGLRADGVLGYGTPSDELVRIAREQQLDLLVLGAHGHRFLADLALGQTVSPVLHRLPIPVLVVPQR